MFVSRSMEKSLLQSIKTRNATNPQIMAAQGSASDEAKVPLERLSGGVCSFDPITPNAFHVLDKMERSIITGLGNGAEVSSGACGGRGKRGRGVMMEPLDKAAQQRQKRMIKNRESAARSRERKQMHAYQVELESLAVKLEEENEQLWKEKEAVKLNVTNDAVIARAYQEEFTRLADEEASGYTNSSEATILGPPGRENNHKTVENLNHKERERNNNCQRIVECSADSGKEEKLLFDEDELCSIDITDEASVLDGEVEKRLNQMVPVSIHVPADASNPNVWTSMGSTTYAPENDALIWKIRSFSGGKE